MEITAKEISILVNGDIIGDPNVVVHAPGGIEEAEKGYITFLGNPKYEPYIYTSKASIIVVPKSLSLLQDIDSTLIMVDNVYSSIGLILSKFDVVKGPKSGISPMAFVCDKVQILESVTIGAYSIVNEGVEIGNNCIIFDQVYIGHNVKIGSGTIIYPGVKIYNDSVIGKNCILHANAVIGSDGFGFSRGEGGKYTKIPQIGNVVLGNNVEIGACTVIDRATMGSTLIKSGVKLDNLIQVAHNVEIGQNTVIAAQTGISGSTKLGQDCMIGGQVGFAGHLNIAEKTMVQAQSGVAGNISQPNSKLYGYPAIEYQQYLRAYAYFKKLPEIVQSIRELEQKVDRINNDNNL